MVTYVRGHSKPDALPSLVYILASPRQRQTAMRAELQQYSGSPREASLDLQKKSAARLWALESLRIPRIDPDPPHFTRPRQPFRAPVQAA